MFQPILDGVLKYASQATRANAQKPAHVFIRWRAERQSHGSVGTENTYREHFWKRNQPTNHSKSYIILTGEKVPGLALSLRAKKKKVCTCCFAGQPTKTQKIVFPNNNPVVHIRSICRQAVQTNNSSFKEKAVFDPFSFLFCLQVRSWRHPWINL